MKISQLTEQGAALYQQVKGNGNVDAHFTIAFKLPICV